MRLYFGGAEIGSHRDILAERDVRHVAMSYMGLRRRVKFAKPWLIEEKFRPGTSVFLDSGAYTINAQTDKWDEVELTEIFDHYKDFVLMNLDRVDLVSEFDALPLGLEWIEEQREEFWSQIPHEKFMAVWHPVWGLPYLHEMASRYEVIGIPDTSLDGRNLRPVLNAIAAKGTRIHGVAMTRTEELLSIHWDSVASTSWISPQRYGDTIVWTGNELKRYPRKYKDQARRRHRRWFTENGFDADKLAEDDSSEVLRLSVWSWQKFEEYVNRRRHQAGGVTPHFSDREPDFAQTQETQVDPQADEVVDKGPTPPPAKAVSRRREATEILPVMGMHQEKDEDDKDKPPTLHIRSDSPRVCNTCFLAEKCPGYEPDSNCLYNIPIVLRTREQIRAMHQGMLEMQTQRVMFMRMAEEIEGGYADPNLTKEMTLLTKMLNDYAEMEREGFSITVNARGSSGGDGSPGMISRIFGREAGQQVQELEGGPVRVDDVIDAEIVGEDG